MVVCIPYRCRGSCVGEDDGVVDAAGAGRADVAGGEREGIVAGDWRYFAAVGAS